jgi:class 3 adenylate cyclase
VAPKTQYAWCGDRQLAYQVVGDGDVDIVVAPSFVSHVELWWTSPAAKAFYDRLASFARVAIFDKAGTGLSDPVAEVPTLEERALEIEAVMDAVGMEHATVFGLSEGGPMAVFFGATRRDRTDALVLFGAYPKLLGVKGLDLAAAVEEADMDTVKRAAAEAGLPDDEVIDQEQLERVQRFGRHILEDWGEGKALKELVPHQGSEAELGLMERLCASPGMARATMSSAIRLDVSDLLESIDVPTLIVHARDDLVPIQGARTMARLIPNSRLLELDGVDHAPWLNSPDEVTGEIEQMLTGARRAQQPNRVLATVLFTDIVGSTERAAELGDARWRAVLEHHDEVTRQRVATFNGTAVKGTGDGYLAIFDGPAAAIRCAEAVRDALAQEQLRIRAGVHTGEIERIGEDVGGLGIHLASRVCDTAAPGEILVSRTVCDLVVGSGLAFEDRGIHQLKGIPGEWSLAAVAAEGSPAGALERQLAEIDLAGTQRPTDRLFAAIARRAPGAVRTKMRLNPNSRRTAKKLE